MVMRWLMVACLAGGLGHGALADGPQRVLSMNLCTDQLAMLLAGPGQLISVSHLAGDPLSSAMADRAADYPVNHGLAEEIYLLRPDLVLAGAYTGAGTVAMLRRLGMPVQVFQADNDLDDLRANILRMGDVLGRPAQAAKAVAQFDADLAALQTTGENPRPRAVTYAANGYSSGAGTLSGAIIAAAGFDNIGQELGLGMGGNVPLEVLMLTDPDLVVTGHPYAGASRAEEVLDHPGLRAILSRSPRVVSDGDWVCGTPHVLRAIAELAAARRAM